MSAFDPQKFDLVVVSHLRWNFVWQRPQQLLSRLAQYHRILFVEEPIFAQEDDTNPSAICEQVQRNVTTLVPVVPQSACGDTPLWLWPDYKRIMTQVQSAMKQLEFGPRALWHYTPIPEFMPRAVQPELLVYDVMDELANFKFAPGFLKDREQQLLGDASIVFTGGASLYDSKKHLNPNTHLFASGVDSNHYASALNPTTTEPDWMKDIPHPRATYIGVIDERLDYDLIAAMAAARPDIQFLMCGPFAKVDPAQLPHTPNLHYPGQQSYADLPRILKGTDVCLMPFARNEATQFISPTKTLEYMATGRPIVSTPIKDVEQFYSDIVYLADTPEAFIAQIDTALNEQPEERARKRKREEKILAEQAWDAIADSMENLMQREWAKTPTGKTQVTAERLAALPPTVKVTPPDLTQNPTASRRPIVSGE